MDIEPGTVVANRYRISRPLGRGGMGEVFAAENVRTGRPVAVKLLRSDSKAKSSAVARFRQEARAAGSINSDHVTQVLDVEEDSEHGVVLVFELLEGESLIDRLKRTGPIPFGELHSIIEQVWMGLADAHRAGIIHRDLKPSNVFLEHRPDGTTRVKILDFGISKLPKEMGGETLTEMGQSLGTFSFMPPEQIGKAKMVDHRADIYACATMIYQSLTGQLPYAARNILVMVEKKAKEDARKLSEAMGAPVDHMLEAFVTQGLARDPGKRFQTALEALAAWRDLRPTAAAPEPASSKQLSPGSGQAGRGPGPQRSVTPMQRPAVQHADAPGDADTAATISMPAAHFAEQASNEAPPRIDPRMSSPVGALSARGPVAPDPRLGFGGTQPVRMVRPVTPISPTAQVINAARSTGAGMAVPAVPASEKPSSEEAKRNPVGHSSGYYTPPSVSQGPSSGGPSTSVPMSPRPLTPATVRVVDDPTSIPTSSEGATQVYRPQAHNAARLVGVEPSAQLLATSPQPVVRKRSSMWTFLLGALAFLLVGFGIVAAIMLWRAR